MTRSGSIFQQLAMIGKQLAHPPHTKDAILKQLKQAGGLLSEMKQSHEAVAPLQQLTKALALPMLLKHKDKDVRLLTTNCIVEIMRIVAPDAPYTDEELQEIFHSVVLAFKGLNDISSSSFPRRSTILEIMANMRICVIMLDVGCDDLISEMFQTFFSVVSDRHPPSVVTAMETIMAAVLQESENIPLQLLDLILKNLLKHNKGVSSAAHKLAVGVVQQCAEKLEPYIQRLLTSVMLEGKEAEINLHADYHDIIHEIYQWAPQMLLAVIPNLTQELVNDHTDVRLKAVKLLGRLFALPGQHVAKEYRQLFSEFLKRFTDKAVEVRLAMVECAKNCVRANPSGTEAIEILAGLDDRILDNEELVRLHTVMAICDVAKQNFKCIPGSLLTHVAERLRDKKVLVRKEAFQRLCEVYRAYCAKCYEGSFNLDKQQLEWIPGKLLRCCYDKDVKEFRPAALEIVFSDNLFPRQLSVVERTKHWMAMYSVFEDSDKKALGRILLQKKRFQDDMSEYLSIREKEKDISLEDARVLHLLKAMQLSFLDNGKVEEKFQKFHNMKDKKIFKALSQLLDPGTSYSQSEEIIDDLLKRIGENHPQHEFFKVLSLRCSYRIFSKEHAKAVLEELSVSGELHKDMAGAGLSLLADFSGVFLFLIQDVKEDLLALLLEGDGTIKERVAEILGRAGSFIRGYVEKSSSSIELTLQTLCLEGTRKQAKYAIAALEALNGDEGFKSLSVLYGRLIERLKEDNSHLPTILQSLSCIAQHAVTIFETQEDDIVRFVVRNLLQKDSVEEAQATEDCHWDSLSTVCQLKIYGLKALVKSFLPHKEHMRKRLRGLLGLLSKLLVHGGISENTRLSERDKAQLRLASAKGVLRLARRWDVQIPVQLFHACMYVAQDSYIQVRQQFLKKVHQYMKDHTLNHKYASAYDLVALDSSREILTNAKHYLADFIESCRREVRLQQKSAGLEADAPLLTYNPEYVLMYLVHVLAHHPSFPDADSTIADAYEPFYRFLLFFLRYLVLSDSDGLGKKDADNLPAILAIFRTIKRAEDALEENKTTALHILCDLGIIITKELGRSSLHSETYPGVVPLPSSFYRVKTDDSHDNGKVDGSDLPACLVESDALYQLWSRGSRPGQAQPLSSTQLPKKAKRDAEESSSSEQEVVDGRNHEKQSDSVEATVAAENTDNEYRAQPKRKTRKGRMEMEKAEELEAHGEGLEHTDNIESPSKGKRQSIHGMVSERDQKARDTVGIGVKSARTTRCQGLGMKIVMGSNAGVSDISQQNLPDISRSCTDAEHSEPHGSDDISLHGADEENRRPQTRSRKAAAKLTSQVEMESKTSSIMVKKKTIVAAVEVGDVDDSEGAEQKEMEKTGHPVDETSKEQWHEGRVLRNRTKMHVGAQKAMVEPTDASDESEHEVLATWRTRRRKVQ